MNIVEVKQPWPDDFFRIDLYIGNICNYKCWYCFPGCNTGTYKWPDFDLYVKHISYILDYYKEHTNKKKFQIHLIGGEVTHWSRFVDFIKHFKQNYDCRFSLTTNASKKLDWWKEAGPYLDRISISHHQSFSKKEHNRDVADYLYSKNVLVNVEVMMDPSLWDECVNAIEYYKNSKHAWSIRCSEVIHDKASYTDEQKELLKTLTIRSSNILYYLKTASIRSIKTSVIDEAGKKHKVNDHQIVTDRLNNFKGWECNLGVDWLNVKFDGEVSGICGNKLYNGKEYNVFDEDFMEKFQPEITTTICQQPACWCNFETNMNKKKC